MYNSPAPVFSQLPTDLQMVAACCAHPQSECSQRQVDDLASRIEDWDAVYKVALRHQVGGFVHDRLQGNNHVPLRLQRAWSGAAKKRAAHNLRQAIETVRVHELLRDNEIPNLVLKGLTLATHLYGSLAIKRSSDIDLLVNPADAPQAIRLLQQEGYFSAGDETKLTNRQVRAMLHRSKELTLRHASGHVVDLHWRLVTPRHMLAGIEPFEGSRSVQIDQAGAVASLGRADELVYLCAHGALSNWSRLKWLVDVNALIRISDEAALVDAYDHSRKLNADVCVLQAFGLCRMVWGTQIPGTLVDRVDQLAECGLLDLPIQQMLGSYRTKTALGTLRRITRTASVRSHLYKSRMRALADTTDNLFAVPDVLAMPLPRALGWLYPIARPFFWIARRLRRT